MPIHVPHPQTHSDRAIALWLALLLATVGLLLFSGRFHSIDEVSSVALTESMVTLGRPTTDQIPWSQSWQLAQGTYGVDGHLYSKKGIGLSLLAAPLLALARALPGVAIVPTVMLTNVWVTALTGALLFALGRRLGFARGAALFAALAWGMATIAPVYSKTLFNSPAVALAFVAALCWLVPTEGRGPGVARCLFAGALLGWTLLTRAENALVVPLCGAYLLWATPGALRERLARAVAFGIPLVATVLLLFWFNWLRFGNVLDFGYDLSTEASGDLLVGLAGILASPGRSIFLLTPLLLPALWGLRWLPRGLAALILGTSAVYLLFFARAVDWWGGWNWGIRYLLPLLPLWCLGLAPLWQRTRWRPPLAALALLSALLQLPGLLVDFNIPLAAALERGTRAEDQLWTLAGSQWVAHLRALPDWRGWDVVWVATGAGWLAVAGLALMTVSVWGLRRALQGGAGPRGLALALGGLLLLTTATIWQAGRDPFWQRHDAALAPLAAEVADAPPDSLLILELSPYRDYFGRAQAWLNRSARGPRHIQIVQQAEPDASQIATLLRAITGARTIFLAVEATPPGDPASGSERWLAGRFFAGESRWTGGETRLRRFAVGEAPTLAAREVALADGVTLAVGQTNAGAPLHPGDALLVELVWRATQPPRQDYTVFLQLLGPGGVVAQVDSPPQAGFAPTSGWQAGERVADRHLLYLPATLPPGDYALIAGMYDATGARLSLVAGGDFVSLGTVRVAPPS